MKKILLTVFLICGIVLFLSAQSPDQNSGVIRELTGDVEIKPAGTSAFVSAKAGDAVAIETVVSTGFKSTAIIEAGSSMIMVRPLTRLSLSEIQKTSNTENLNMNLQTGRIKVDVKPPASTAVNFTVKSPSATASVRGTSFEFDTKNLKVFEGKVLFFGKSGLAMMIPAGSGSFVDNDGNAMDPAKVFAAGLTPPPPVGSDSQAGSPGDLLQPALGQFSIPLIYE